MAEAVSVAWPDAKASPPRVKTSPRASRFDGGSDPSREFGFLAGQGGVFFARRGEFGGLVAGDVEDHVLGLLARGGFRFGGGAQALGFLGLDLRFYAQAFGFLARAFGVLAAGFDQQFAAFAIQAIDVAARGFGARGEFGGFGAAAGDLHGMRAIATARRGDGVDGLARAQAFVGAEALQAGVGVQRQQTLRERGRGIRAGRHALRRGPCDRRGLVAGAELQALAQFGDFVGALRVIGLGGGRAAACEGEFAIGGRGLGQQARLVLVAPGHRRLRSAQRAARRCKFGRCVLVRVGALRARDRLLRRGQLAGGRRQASAARERGRDHKAANPRVLRFTEVCEAWAHRGAVLF